MAAAAEHALPHLTRLERLQLDEYELRLPSTLTALTWLRTLSVLQPYPLSLWEHEAAEQLLELQQLVAACSRLQRLTSLTLQLPHDAELSCLPALPRLQRLCWGTPNHEIEVAGQLPAGRGAELRVLAAPMQVVMALQPQLEAGGVLHTLCTWGVCSKAQRAALQRLAALPSLRLVHVYLPMQVPPISLPSAVSACVHIDPYPMAADMRLLLGIDQLFLSDDPFFQDPAGCLEAES